MGFKLPGKSIISGTSAHSSALKMKAEANAAAKMKREAAAKMKMEAAAKMGHKSATKLKKDSPVDKTLVGKQHNLPEELKAKIEAAPGKMKPSPVKESFSQAYRSNRDAGKKYFTYKGKEYTTESRSEKAERQKTGKTYAELNPRKSMTKTVKDKAPKSTETPRVTKTVDKNINKSKTVRRKDGSVKRTVDKNVTVEDGVKTKTKTKETFDKKGNLKKSVYTSKNKGEKDKQKVVYDTKTQNEKRSKSVTKKDGVKRKLKTKYDDKGTQKKQKEVAVKDGRRTVKKYDAKTGETTTKSRRTLKGFLTGKGKKKKEENVPGDAGQKKMTRTIKKI